MLLDMMDADKVVLLNGDTASKLVDKHNRVTYPLIGDAGSVTVMSSSSASASRFIAEIMIAPPLRESLQP